jgi:NADH-quinone oxidoreductase subunit K
MLSSVNLMLATFSRTQGESAGSIIALLMIAVIAAEAAVFLAMIVSLFRSKRTIDSDNFTLLSQREAQ